MNTTPKTDAAEFSSDAIGLQPQKVVPANFARLIESYWNNVRDSLPVSVASKGRWQYAIFYGGYWYVKRSHAERMIEAARAPRPEAAPHWIPVSEKKPRKFDSVLLADGYTIITGFYDRAGQCVRHDAPDAEWEATHWMPLPAHPSPQGTIK